MNKQTGGLRCGAEFDDELAPPDVEEPQSSDEEELDNEEVENNVEFG